MPSAARPPNRRNLRQPVGRAQASHVGFAGGTGFPAVQEPGKRRVFPVPYPRPGDLATVLRPGQRHVEQTQLVGMLFVTLPVDGRRRWPHIQHRRPGVPIVVLGGGLAFRLMTEPGERGEHHGKLQSLGAVHRDDLHQVLVALQAELRGFAAAFRLCLEVGEPVQQSAPRQAVAGLGVVEQVGEVQEVGQAARPVRIPQQVGRACRPVGKQQVAHQAGDAVPGPDPAPLAGVVVPGRPGLIVFPQPIRLHSGPDRTGRPPVRRAAGRRRRIRSRRRRARANSWCVAAASALSNTLSVPSSTVRTPPCRSASAMARPCMPVRTSTAMSPATRGLPAAAPDARRATAAPSSSSRTILAAACSAATCVRSPLPHSLPSSSGNRCSWNGFGSYASSCNAESATVACRRMRGLEADFRQQEGIVPPERGVHGAHQGGVGSVVDRQLQGMLRRYPRPGVEVREHVGPRGSGKWTAWGHRRRSTRRRHGRLHISSRRSELAADRCPGTRRSAPPGNGRAAAPPTRHRRRWRRRGAVVSARRRSSSAARPRCRGAVSPWRSQAGHGVYRSARTRRAPLPHCPTARSRRTAVCPAAGSS